MSSLSSYVAKKVLNMDDLVIKDAFKLIKLSIQVQDEWKEQNKDLIENMDSLLLEIKKRY